MRHIWSLVAGVVIAPVAWFLVAFGQSAMTQRVTLSSSEDDFLLGGLLIVGVGLLLGLIGSLRTSPVAPLFTALIYLSFSGYMLVDPMSAADLFSRTYQVGGYDVVLSTPLHTGTLAVIGGMLLIAVFSPSRWRGAKPPPDPDAWRATDPVTEWKPPYADLVSTPTPEDGVNKSS